MSLAHAANVTARGEPAASAVLATLPPRWRAGFPAYCALLDAANGLSVHGGLVRIFGAGERCLGRDALRWNAGEWRAEYRLPDSVLLWGETVLGDQLAVDTATGTALVVRCETGRHDLMPCSPAELLDSVLQDEPRRWVDVDLVAAAAHRGLRPSLLEHLAWSEPLIVGGRRAADNLEVMHGDVHMYIQGQILERTRHLPPGTIVKPGDLV